MLSPRLSVTDTSFLHFHFSVNISGMGGIQSPSISFCLYMGCPESFRTFKIARHCVDLAGCGKCYSLVMSLTNCVAKTALPYLAQSLCCASLCDHMFGASGDSLETRKGVFFTSNEFVGKSVTETFEKLKIVFGEETMCRTQAYEW